MKYSICIVSPSEYAHSNTFYELALGLQGGLAELGIKAPILRWPEQQPKGQGIFLGANILPAFPKLQLPDNSIFYNLEQVTETSGWIQNDYLELLRRHEVWDYSQRNINELTLRGVHNVRFCGVGYAKALEHIDPDLFEDIDVLFYGSIFGRRLPILDAIESTGLRVQKLFGVYGAERDSWIARSKIVLNIHAYETTTFEIVRCSYLWANKKCIISEPSDEIPHGMDDALLIAPAETLPLLCEKTASDARLRISVATRGYGKFKDMRQSQYLKDLIT